MDILITVVNQRLMISTNLKVLVSGTQQFIRFVFDLPSEWDDLSPFAQFTQGDTSYNVYLDEDNAVFLPSEIEPGKCTLMLYGSGGTVIGTTNMLTLTIDASGFVADVQSTVITQSLYDQLIARVNALQNTVNTKQAKLTVSQNTLII